MRWRQVGILLQAVYVECQCVRAPSARVSYLARAIVHDQRWVDVHIRIFNVTYLSWPSSPDDAARAIKLRQATGVDEGDVTIGR